MKNYRLSLSLAAVYPEGDGALNQKGVGYNTLIDAMLNEGITPWVTLFHWDLPQALEDRGGWRSRVTPDAFKPYAETAVKALGDRVKNWITLNEIRCFTNLAHGQRRQGPGHETQKVINQTFHHALLCHGHAITPWGFAVAAARGRAH